MNMLLFAGLLVCVYFGTMVSFHFWIKKQPLKTLDERLDIGAGVFCLAAIMLGLAGVSIVFGMPTPSVYAKVLLPLFLIVLCEARFPSVRARCVWIPSVCVLGTLALTGVAPDMVSTPFDWGIIFGVWSVVMSIIIFFDRVPLLNFLTFGAWSLALAVVGFLNDFIPSQITVPSLLVFAALWGCVNILSRNMKSNLGPYCVAILGFVMGGIMAICVGMRSYGSIMAMMGYYLFECFFFGLAWLGLHPLNMNRGEFAFTKILFCSDPVRIIKIVFYRLVILALIGVMMWQTDRLAVLFLIVLVVLLDTYNRFKSCGANAPSIKSMWQETKTGLKELWRHRFNLFKQSSDESQVSHEVVKEQENNCKVISKKKIVRKATKKIERKTVQKRTKGKKKK